MRLFDTEKTIVAISTPIGVGGISIVRMSGKNAITIADKLFSTKKGINPSDFNNRELVLGKFNGSVAKDNCLCVVFRAPNSFTGENMVEFQCHGGVKITECILSDCIKMGASMAENGEFSMRAFLNGKLSLSEAEGMIDLINAESESELTAGYNLMNGKLNNEINNFQKELIDILSEIEVSFDYPEEDIEYTTIPLVKEKLDELIKRIDNLLLTKKTGSVIKNGINAVIVGRPNVGKSSILNSLLNKNKAIVTDIAGTTRDVIEDAFEINGVKVNIIDTAGIRKTKDIVEKIGVDKSYEQIKLADVVLLVLDNSSELTGEDKELLDLIKDKKHIIIANKIDKPTKYNYKNLDKNMVFVSASTGENINKIKEMIFNLVIDKNLFSGEILITNTRHINALERAKKALVSAYKNIDDVTLDLVSVDIHEAYNDIGEITGNSSNEAILDSVFSKFCLGK